MSVFGDYAEYYNLFYQDKDYEGEVRFVEQAIRRYLPTSTSLIDFGCGTARHVVEFAKSGWQVCGVDLSDRMISAASAELKHLPGDIQSRVSLVEGDVSKFVTEAKYDAVISLFHVLSYQVDNNSVIGMMRSARESLKDGGLLVCDFWHGPGVLADRPAVRIKRIETPHKRIMRIAEPKIDTRKNTVYVNYTLLVNDLQTRHWEELHETHAMRYFFMPELEFFASQAGFEVLEAKEWMSTSSLTDSCWAGYFVARSLGKK